MDQCDMYSNKKISEDEKKGKTNSMTHKNKPHVINFIDNIRYFYLKK